MTKTTLPSFQDTKPHAEFSFSQIVDALECDYPVKGNSPSPQISPQSHSSTSGDDDIVQRDAHIFKIVTTKRTLLLCAPTEEEEVRWLGAISALIARRGNSPGAPKSIPKAPQPESGSPSRSPTASGMAKGKSKRPNSLTGGSQDTA
jgi:pleckstrin homology domain-containing family A member 1/2